MYFFEKFKSFVNIYKVNLLIGGALLLLILISNFSIYYLLLNDSNQSRSNDLISDVYYEEEKEIIIDEEVTELFYKVDIKGAVNNPGVYELKDGARVIDVISLAGGLLDTADTSVTNLSKYIADEMVIVIYTKDEVSNFKVVIEEEKQEEKQCIIYNEIIQNDSCKEVIEENKDESNLNTEIDTKISINTADITLLMTLPGVGESKAKSIIEYREQNGMFTKIEDIMNVSGIGEKLFEEIKNYITV